MTGDLPDLLARRADLGGDMAAIVDTASGQNLSYIALDARAAQAAGMLRALGIGEGERIAFLARNRAEFFELLFACARIGVILVPLSWRMPAAELDVLLEDCAPRLLLVGAGEREVAFALKDAPPVIDLDGDYAARRDDSASVAPRPWDPAAIWYLLYTSGTTGLPKAVIYTFGMAIANHGNITAATGLRAGDRTSCFLPLSHTAGINLHALPTLFAGGEVTILEAFDADSVVALLAERRLDLFFAVPTVYEQLFEHPAFASAPLSAVRHWSSGGAPLIAETRRRARSLGIRLCNGMGMTETGPTALLQDPQEAWDQPESVGRPQLLCRARIAGAAGREAAPGEIGELQFAGPGVTPGYWRREEATRAVFTQDGWLRSGDLARVDAEGRYFIAGRAKEMFISGGENVFPAEVEQVLREHPRVADAAVIGRPDARWGECGLAFVEMRGRESLDEQELAAFCRSRIAGYKIPTRFIAVHEFPRTAAGKIKKHLLDADAEDPEPQTHALASVTI